MPPAEIKSLNPMPPVVSAGVKVEARVAQGALVISFTGPGLPKVWRADMTHAASAALELEEAGGKISLVMKTPSSAETVYVFPDRQSAVEALKAITRALFQGSGATAAPAPIPEAAPPAAPKPGRGIAKKVLAVLLFCLIVVAALHVLTRLAGPSPQEIFTKAINQPPVAIQKGVPVPADQLFGK